MLGSLFINLATPVGKTEQSFSEANYADVFWHVSKTAKVTPQVQLQRMAGDFGQT